MTAEQMRTLREANPFRPFTIHMAGGRSFRVTHRDYLSLSPAGRTVIVYQENDAFNVLDLFLINELAVDPSAPAEPGPQASHP